jgi:hypothetical protein
MFGSVSPAECPDPGSWIALNFSFGSRDRRLRRHISGYESGIQVLIPDCQPGRDLYFTAGSPIGRQFS